VSVIVSSYCGAAACGFLSMPGVLPSNVAPLPTHAKPRLRRDSCLEMEPTADRNAATVAKRSAKRATAEHEACFRKRRPEGPPPWMVAGRRDSPVTLLRKAGSGFMGQGLEFVDLKFGRVTL